MVERGELDVAIVRYPVDPRPGLDLLVALEEELGVLVSAGQPLAG
jgi:DNA-binding transcriptional LysR family regulator